MKKPTESRKPVVVEVKGPFIPPRSMPIGEAAKYLGGIDPQAIEAATRNGELPFKWSDGHRGGKQGRAHKIIEKTDLDQWWDKRRYADGTKSMPALLDSVVSWEDLGKLPEEERREMQRIIDEGIPEEIAPRKKSKR